MDVNTTNYIMKTKIKDLNPNLIEALIFDLDGTLADTMPLHLEAWNHVAKEYGFEFTSKDHNVYAGIPTQKIVEMIAEKKQVEVDSSLFVARKEAYFLSKFQTVTPIEPVAQFAYQLHGKMKMAVGTGGVKDVARDTLEQVKLTSYFEVVISADDVTQHKPNPDTFLEAAKQLGVKPENCLVFEDAPNGFKAAHAAGMQCLDIQNATAEEMNALLQTLLERKA